MIVELQPSLGRALVLGGGAIALRKLQSLAEAGFASLVVAPALLEGIRALPGVECEERSFERADIARERWALVFACTDNREVNRQAGELARAAGIPVVVTDAQSESTFFTPATIRDGSLAIAISTGGAAPAVTKALRAQLREALGEGWSERIEQAARERKRAIGADLSPAWSVPPSELLQPGQPSSNGEEVGQR